MGRQDANKQRLARIFTGVAATYDRIGPNFFSSFGKGLVEYCGITGGACVLDAACGRGAVLFPACKAVGQAGRVIGIDLSAGMIKESRRQAEREGMQNLRVLTMDAEMLAFPAASFDFVLCGLGLPFFTDPLRALGEFFRVLKPGGLFAASMVKEHSSRKLLESAYTNNGADPKQGRNIPIVSMDSGESLEKLLARARFTEIEVTVRSESFRYQDAEQWWGSLNSHGYRACLEQLDGASRENYRSDVMAKARTQQSSCGFIDTWSMLFMKAMKSTVPDSGDIGKKNPGVIPTSPKKNNCVVSWN